MDLRRSRVIAVWNKLHNEKILFKIQWKTHVIIKNIGRNI